MITRMRYETGMTVAAHHHEHEQAGYVINGRYRQTAAGTANELRWQPWRRSCRRIEAALADCRS